MYVGLFCTIAFIGVFEVDAEPAPTFDQWTSGYEDINVWKPGAAVQRRAYLFKVSSSGEVLVTVSGYRHFYNNAPGYTDQIPDQIRRICEGFYGTQVQAITSVPEWGLLTANRYPELVKANCVNKQDWLSRKRLEELQQEERLLAERTRKDREEEVKKREQETVAAEGLQEKKEECTSFGFKPQSPEHAECVMKMTIAEKARNAQAGQIHELAEKSAAEAAAYRTDVRDMRAEQAAADAKDQEAAKRQRESQMLLDLGAIISSGGVPDSDSSESVSSSNPTSTFDSGRFRRCVYRVAGELVPVTIPRGESCSPRRNFGNLTGYLVNYTQ
jgi:hypothetical protein